MNEADRRIRELLHALVEQYGPEKVMECLSIDRDHLLALMCGLTGHGAGLGGASEDVGAVAGRFAGMAHGRAGSDGAGPGEGGSRCRGCPVVAGEDVESAPGAPRGRTLSEARQQRMELENLWKIWDIVYRAQYWAEINEREKQYVRRLVNQVELALIHKFGQTLPGREERPWDDRRRHNEIQLRESRLGWIEGRLKREWSGFRVILNLLRGRLPLSTLEVCALLQKYGGGNMVLILEIGNPESGWPYTERGYREFIEGGPVSPARKR